MENDCSYSTPLLPMLAFESAAKAIDWYVAALGAKETARLTGPKGEIGYAEIWIGKASFAVADVWPGNKTPHDLGGTPIVFNLQVENVDEVFARAIANGATEIFPVKDQFYGDRAGRVRDPFGYLWVLSTRIEELSVEEMQKRFDAMCSD